MPGRRRVLDEHRHSRRRARGPVLRDPVQPARARGHVVGAQRARRHVRLRRRVLRRDARRLRGRRPADLRRDQRAASPAGGRSTSSTAASAARRAAMASRRSAASICSTSFRTAPPSWAPSCTSSPSLRRSTSWPPRMTWSSAPTASTASRAASAPMCSGRRSTAQVEVHVARDRPRVRGVHVPHRRDGVGRLPAALLPVRRDDVARSSSRPTRRPGGAPGSTRARRSTWRRGRATSARSSSAANCSPTCSTATS